MEIKKVKKVVEPGTHKDNRIHKNCPICKLMKNPTNISLPVSKDELYDLVEEIDLLN